MASKDLVGDQIWGVGAEEESVVKCLTGRWCSHQQGTKRRGLGNRLRWEGSAGYPVGEGQQPAAKVKRTLVKTVRGPKKCERYGGIR